MCVCVCFVCVCVCSKSDTMEDGEEVVVSIMALIRECGGA